MWWARPFLICLARHQMDNGAGQTTRTLGAPPTLKEPYPEQDEHQARENDEQNVCSGVRQLLPIHLIGQIRLRLPTVELRLR